MKSRFVVIVVLINILLSSCSELQSVFNKNAQVAPTAKTKADKNKNKKVSPSEVATATGVVSGFREAIITQKGTYYFVAPGDTLPAIAKEYKISKEDLAQINDLYDSPLVVGRRLFIPNRKHKKEFVTVTDILRERKLEKDRSSKPVKFIWPLKEFVQTSPFGWRRGRPHDGLDLSAKIGTPVFAAADGKVIFSKRFAGYGNLIVIKHAKNYFTAYAHIQHLMADVGQKVKRGQQIATVGSTGRSTGPHLHFEVHEKTVSIDPNKIMPPKDPNVQKTRK